MCLVRLYIEVYILFVRNVKSLFYGIFFCFFRWVGCWQVKTFSRLWTAFWRGSATSNSWSPPGPKICLRTTVREVLPPLLPPPRLPLLPPRTHLPTAPRPPPPAPPLPAVSTWRCSVRRRKTRQGAVRRYQLMERSRRRDHHKPGAGEEAWHVIQDMKTALKLSFMYRAYNISQAI